MSSSAMSFTSSSQKSVSATKTSALADFIASTGPEDSDAKHVHGRTKIGVKSASSSQGKSLRQKMSLIGLFSKPSSSSPNKQQKHVSIQHVASPPQIPTASSGNSTSARHVSIKVDYAALYKPETELTARTGQHRRQPSGQSSSILTEESIFSFTGDKDDSTTLSSFAKHHPQQQQPQRTASGSASSSGYSYIPSSSRRLMRSGSGGGSSSLDAATTTLNSPSSIRHPPHASIIEEEATTAAGGSHSSSPSKLMESLAQLQMMRSQHHTANPVSPPPAGPAPSTSKDLPPPPPPPLLAPAPALRVASPVPSLSQRRLLAQHARRRDLMDEQERRLDESVNVLRKELEEGSGMGEIETAAATEPPPPTPLLGWTMSTPQTIIDYPPPPEELHVVIGDAHEDGAPANKRHAQPLQLVRTLNIPQFPSPAVPLAASSPAEMTERQIRSKDSQQQLASSALLPTPEQSPVRTNDSTMPPPPQSSLSSKFSHREAVASSPAASTSSKQTSVADDRLRALEEKNWILEQALRVLLEKDLAKDSGRY